MKHFPFSLRYNKGSNDIVLVGNVAFQSDALMYFSKIVVSATTSISAKLYFSKMDDADGEDVSKFIVNGKSEEGQGAIISGALLRPKTQSKSLLKSYYLSSPMTILDIDDKVMLAGGFALMLSVDAQGTGEVNGCFVWEEGSAFNTPNIKEVTTDPVTENTDG